MLIHMSLPQVLFDFVIGVFLLRVRVENASARAHLFCLLVSVDHLRALFCSELDGIWLEPALLVILAHLHGLSPWSCLKQKREG